MNATAALLLLAILLFGAQSFLDVRGDSRMVSPSSEAAEASSGQHPATQLATVGCTPKGSLVPIVLSYSVVGGGSGYSAPVLNYVVNRTSSSVALTANPTTYYMDPRTTWRTTNLLPGSPSTERWATSQAVSGTAAQCVTVLIQYTHQYLTDLEFSVSGGGLASGQEPTITYSAFGSRVSTRTVGSTWMDAGAQYSYTNPLSGSSQSQRWFALAPTGNVSSASRVSPVYYYQVRVAISYTQVGTGGTPPTLSSTSFGSPLRFVVNATAVQWWLDAGSAYSFTNPLSGSTSAERWATGSATGIISQQSALSPQFFHQYLVTPSYTQKGGGSVRPPTLSYSSFGALNSLILPAVASQSLWMDTGSRYSAQNPLDGSSATERWTASSSNGTVSSAQQPSFPYYHQFAQAFNYSVIGGGSPLPPILTGVQFGKIMNTSLSSRTGILWLDNSSSWSVSNPLSGSSSTERWITNMAVGGAVSRAGSAGLSYSHQYYITVEVSPTGSGSVAPQSDWQNAGVTLALVATPGPGWGFQGWQGSGNGSYSGPNTSVSILPRGAVTERANLFSGILLNATDGGTVSFQFGQKTGIVKEGTLSNLLVPLGTNISLRAASTSPFTKFDSWSGDLTSTMGQVSVVVNSPMVITASFVYDYVNLVLAGAAGIVIVGASGTIMTRRRNRRSK